MITQMLLASGGKFKAEIVPVYNASSTSNLTAYSWGSVSIGSSLELKGRKRYVVVVSSAGKNNLENLTPTSCSIDGVGATRIALSSIAVRHSIGVFIKEITSETSVTISTSFQTYGNDASIQVFVLYAHDHIPTNTGEYSDDGSATSASISSTISAGGVGLYAALVDTSSTSLTWSNVDSTSYNFTSTNYRYSSARSASETDKTVTVGYTLSQNSTYRRLIGCSWR